MSRQIHEDTNAAIIMIKYESGTTSSRSEQIDVAFSCMRKIIKILSTNLVDNLSAGFSRQPTQDPNKLDQANLCRQLLGI